MFTRTRDQCCQRGCPGRGQYYVDCGTCPTFYHAVCLGLEDEPQLRESNPFICDWCRKKKDEDKMELEMLRRLMRSLRPAEVPQPLVLPEFHGLEHEDPAGFISRCRDLLTEAHIDPSQWSRLVQQQLKGPARDWLLLFSGIPFSWEELQQGLTHRFDSPAVRATLQASLYGKHQRENEAADQFITGKIFLYRRLFPNADPNTIIPVIIELLRPQLRPFLRHPVPTTTMELIHRAVPLEGDIKHTAAKHHSTSSSNAPRCHYCPGYHYNRDCPVRQQRRTDPARHIPISSPVAQMALAPDEEETVPRIDIRMGTLAATAVVDSAASRNIINAAKIPNGSTIRARQDVIHLAQREQTMATQGEAEIPVTLAGTTKPINFLVAPELRADAILGNTWLRDMSAQLDYRQGQLRLGNGAVVPLINNPRTGEGTKPEPQRDAAPGGRQQPPPPVKPVPGDPAKEERYQHLSGHVSGPPSQSGRKEDPLASRPLELHMLEIGVTSDSHAPTAAEGICCSEEVPQVEDPLEKGDPGGSQTVAQDVADTRHKVTPPTATEGMPDPLRGGNPTSDGPYSEVTSNTDIPRYIRSPETTGTTNELSGPGCWRAVTTCKEAKPSPPNPDRPADTPTPSQTTPEAARSDAAAPLPVLPPQRRKRSGQPDQIAVCALAMCDQTERAIDASVVVPQGKRNKIVDTRSAFTNHDPNIQTKYDKHRLGPRPP